MSVKPTALDSGLQRLLDEGFEAEVHQQHLLVHSVPYLTKQGVVALGTLVCKYVENAGMILAPNAPGDNHQVWWVGEFPCRANGTFLTDLVADTQTQSFVVFDECVAQHQFSNKPDIWNSSGYPDHYEKMTHYIAVIESQARVVDGDADARTKRIVEPREHDSVFRYADTASVRAEIVATSARLKLSKVAIVGLGGTGAYVFDQVAKTPVQEIHLFDGDDFKQHNAFRAPGAATKEELLQRMKKVEYFFHRYDSMRRGILPHGYYLTADNVFELAGFHFVFVCVDTGPARKVICEYLVAQGIRFVDVGMDVVIDPDTQELDASCRVTTSTPEKSDHIPGCVPMDDDQSDALYRKNIQVADLNALNATSLYTTLERPHFT